MTGIRTTSREGVSFVLKGIVLAGHKLGEEPGSREQLAQYFLNSVLELCRREQLVLDAGQTSQVVAWSSRAAG